MKINPFFEISNIISQQTCKDQDVMGTEEELWSKASKHGSRKLHCCMTPSLKKRSQSLRSFIAKAVGLACKVADGKGVTEGEREEGNWIIKTSRGGVIILMSPL